MNKAAEKSEIKDFLLTASDSELRYFFSPHACKTEEQLAKRFLAFNRIFIQSEDDYQVSDFHIDWGRIFARIIIGLIKEEGDEYAAILSSREQAKTALFRSLIAYMIIYEVTPYIVIVSADLDKCKTYIQAVKQIMGLSDIQSIYGDFLPGGQGGQINTSTSTMYSNKDPKKKALLETYTMKTISKLRGQVHPYTQKKPMFLLSDDKETVTTLQSQAETESGWQSYTSDGIQSMNQKCRMVLCAANYLSTLGNTERDKNAVSSPENLSIVPLYKENEKGEKTILWDKKYCWGDFEAEKTGRVSIESIKRQCDTLEAEGSDYNIFQREYLCQPISKDHLYHDIDKIQRYYQEVEPISEKNGIKYFREYDPTKFYTIGVDTSAGIGRDAQALFLIEHSLNRAEEAAVFADSTIGQIELCDIFLEMASHYGNSIFVVSDANFGMGFNEHIQRAVDNRKYPKEMVYRSDPVAETPALARTNRIQRVGFVESMQNKEMIANAFRHAVENGELILHSSDMWVEISKYTKVAHLDNRKMQRDAEGYHFDRLSAARKAWFGVQNRILNRKKKVEIKKDGLSSRERLVRKYGI